MEVTVRIAGAAGQGVQTTADLLGKIVTRAGLFAHCQVDAESRIRGGLNFSHLRLADRPLAGVVDRVDVLVAQTQEAVQILGRDLPTSSVVISQSPTDHPGAAPFTLDALSKEAGSEKAAGTVALGVITRLLGLDVGVLETALSKQFAGKSEILEFNLRASRLGATAADEWAVGNRFRLPGARTAANRLWLSGAEAIALGAVAAGVSFYAGYPMSPSTGIMTNLAAWATEAGAHVEQAEDEVAAINMVAGAAYAGARAMTATSGGGYCLMTEGVSLIGMLEVPAVIVLCQRPGPATGLPTRTAQGDLNLARHGGHGFFPRILLAPKSISDAFEVTALAFDLAEKYQAPVYVMTDQHLNDSQVTCEPPRWEHLPTQRYYLPPEQLERMPDYRRYAWSDDGLSPMAMPGKSQHLVYADSDEHDERGHMTESGEVADRMVRKRMAKWATIQQAAWPFELTGDADGRPLVVSWGSTWETVREALDLVAEEGVPSAHLHLRWLWPLPGKLRDLIARARRIVVVEGSVGGELANVLQETTLRPVDRSITKRDGRPFTVQELRDQLSEEVRI